jgi:hypothetical protein
MAPEGLPRSIRFVVRIDVQHNPCDLAPVGTFRIRIEHAHVGGSIVIVGNSIRLASEVESGDALG